MLYPQQGALLECCQVSLEDAKIYLINYKIWLETLIIWGKEKTKAVSTVYVPIRCYFKQKYVFNK